MKLRLMAGVTAILIMISGAVSAQDQSETGVSETGVSETGVARISLIRGDVSTQRGDSGDWGAAVLNAPIVSGDRVSTGDGSRAEVQLDHANILRLNERTQANITGLNRTEIQIELAHGLANYSVFKDSEANVEIDTPNMSLHPSRRDGSYRITVVSDDETEVLVRKGDADISTPQGSTHLERGQLITVRGTGNDTQYKIAEAPSPDDWDRWNNDRDHTIRNAESWNHTNRYYVGSEDLDAYGHWSNVPDYGSVWVPTVAPGWAPYQAGRWVWEPYWGWTWVSYDPWGWAPYHYGRWFLWGSSWAWWPGPVYGGFYRPIWAPAYVSFFGFGGGGGFGFGFGSIGWLPIGPCDPFFPWWGSHRSRFNVVNITNINITNINNFHRGGIPPLRSGTQFSNLRLAVHNDRVRAAISTVPAHDFGRGRITPQPVTRVAFHDGRMVAGNLPVVPTRESLRVTDRAAAPSTISRSGQPQRFFTKNRPVAAPQSFEREAAQVRTAIQRDGRLTPVNGNQRSASETNPRSMPRQVGEGPGAMRRGEPAGNNQSGNNRPDQSWRRLGQPAQQPNRPATASPSNPGQRKSAGGESADWRRFPNPSSRDASGSTSPNRGNPAGRANTPDTRRAPASEGNQQWRRLDRPAEPASRARTSPTESPASRDRFQREDRPPASDRGNDWRRTTSTPERNNSVDRFPSRNSAPVQRDSGNWRQSVPRNSGREVSRPPLNMRQPIVTPRYSGPSSSGGYRGNSGGGRSAPSSSPARGGGGSSQPHSSGSSNSGPHRGR
jgi:FecR protein